MLEGEKLTIIIGNKIINIFKAESTEKLITNKKV